MSRRVFVAIAMVVAVGLASAGGYLVGRGDRTTVPDLYGIGLERGGQHEAYVPLKEADLRLGQVRSHVCGGEATTGMIVEQFPAAGADVPVGSAVDIWTAVPEGAVTIDLSPGTRPCQRPSGG